ncbi:MAG: hypothetical protein JRC60_04445 [Deltaproteobacteria bacterium]|nr:hypothetical protein [Deltaproteobacteria bacterium]
MANLTGSASYQGYVRRLETTDPKHPDTWNPNYQTLINNDVYLKQEQNAVKSEIVAAREGETSLDVRLDGMQSSIEGLDPDMQNMVITSIMAALDAAGLANRELERWKNVRIQEGEITILNRGVVSGCTVSKSTTATRNLNLAAGKFFAHGRTYSADAMDNTANVPSNEGAAAETCYAYLYIDGSGNVQCNCTALGEAVPDDGIEIASLNVPAGSDETTAPYLEDVTITDTRRLEPQWPNVFQNPAYEYIALGYILPDAEYAVHHEIVSCEGGREQVGDLLTQDRLKNGFKLYLAGAADAVQIRYTVRRTDI